jgi:hypothetical protein
MPFVVSPTAAGFEQLTLNGLALNDTVFGLEEFSCPPPHQRQEWIGAADSEAQLLVRSPLHENREITALIVVTGSDRDGVDARVAQIVDKIRPEAIPMDGIPLVYQGPAAPSPSPSTCCQGRSPIFRSTRSSFSAIPGRCRSS